LTETQEKVLDIEMNRRDTEKVSSVVRRMHIDIHGGGKPDVGSEATQLHIQILRMICICGMSSPCVIFAGLAVVKVVTTWISSFACCFFDM
jgi:hypothetical protein